MSIPKILKDHATLITFLAGCIVSVSIYINTKTSEVKDLQRDNQQFLIDMNKLDNRVAKLEARDYQLAIFQGVITVQLKTINDKLDRMQK